VTTGSGRHREVSIFLKVAIWTPKAPWKLSPWNFTICKEFSRVVVKAEILYHFKVN
jgi:hypothetical protein